MVDSYNTKKVLITINGVPVQLKGTDSPELATSGDFEEEVFGVDGDAHFRELNNVYYTLTLPLKFDSPNIELLQSLAKNHTIFSASYKDANTGEVVNSAKASVKNIGSMKADEDRTFVISFL